MSKVKVGDQVWIKRVDCRNHLKFGVISEIDGEYYYVRVRGSRCVEELYRHEFVNFGGAHE